IGTPFPSDTIMTLVPLPTLVFPIPFPLFWREQIDHPEKLGTIRFSLPHPFDSTVHAKSAPTSRLPTIASIAANRRWENHIAGACPPKYNRFSRRREFRAGCFADLRADVRGPVLVWEEGVQSQPIVRLSAPVSYSYFHFTLADHVFEIACKQSMKHILEGHHPKYFDPNSRYRYKQGKVKSVKETTLFPKNMTEKDIEQVLIKILQQEKNEISRLDNETPYWAGFQMGS